MDWITWYIKIDLWFYLNISVHGKWGSWGKFGSCSKTCGSGVQERSRKCDSPAPLHGGKKCEGRPRQVQACNTYKCPGMES